MNIQLLKKLINLKLKVTIKLISYGGDNMIISSNIKKYREEKHFTQEELATRMNISRQSISKWERGDALPSIDNLISLSELLDLSLDELILNKEDMPLPLYYGKFKSKKTFIWSLVFPMFLVFYGFIMLPYSMEAFWGLIVGGVWVGAMIHEIGFIDLKRMYTYFTVTKTGIEFFESKKYCPKIIREFRALFDKRPTRFVNYSDIKEMEIYFNNKGFQGHNTVLAYRPRQYFYNREQFELVLYLYSGEEVRLNLDTAYFPSSDERKYFSAMFSFFETRGIKVNDSYNILNSVQNEYDLITEAYKLKKQKVYS